MRHFRSIAFLFETIRSNFDQHPEWASTQYHYISEDGDGKEVLQVYEGLDRTFVFGLWLTRRSLFDTLSADSRKVSLDNVLSEIEERHYARTFPVRVPVRVV